MCYNVGRVETTEPLVTGGDEVAEEQQQDTTTVAADPKGETPTWDTWYEQQDETSRALLEQHTAGLKSALDDERSNRKALAKQIADLTKQAEEGSTLKAELQKLTQAQEAASRKAAFYESAPGDVGNLRLAWLAAEDAGLVDREGVANWTALRKQAPELFRTPLAPKGNGGEGNGQSGPSAAPTINDAIRRAAGRLT